MKYDKRCVTSIVIFAVAFAIQLILCHSAARADCSADGALGAARAGFLRAERMPVHNLAEYKSRDRFLKRAAQQLKDAEDTAETECEEDPQTGLSILYGSQALRAWYSALLADSMIALAPHIPQCDSYLRDGAKSLVADGWFALSSVKASADYAHASALLQNRAKALHMTLPDANGAKSYRDRYDGRFRQAQVLAPAACENDTSD